MTTFRRTPSFTDLEVQFLQKIQGKSSTVLDLIAFAIHKSVRDAIVFFSAPTPYFLVADPNFGLSLLITLCLTELANGMVKLYFIRPRPLWVSTSLQRRGSAWEKDSSFPSSHAQSVATLFAFVLLNGQKYLPNSVWLGASVVTGFLTLLTGFSRAYLAMHFASDVVAGWSLGFLVAFTVTKVDIVETLAQVSVPWAVFLSVFSTANIIGGLLLAAHLGKTGTDQKTRDKWLETALQNGKLTAAPNGGKEAKVVEEKVINRIAPHEVVHYMMPAGAYFSACLFPVLLSLRHSDQPRSPKNSPLALYRPYTATMTKPSLSLWVIGFFGLMALHGLKAVVFGRKRRETWPVWKQALFSLAFYAFTVTWVLTGSGIVHARQGWVWAHI